MAPELAGDMLFFAQQVAEDNSLDPSKSRSHECKNMMKCIPYSKLQRIQRIRQILLRSRVPSIKSGSLKTPWTMPFTEIGRTDVSCLRSLSPLLLRSDFIMLVVLKLEMGGLGDHEL